MSQSVFELHTTGVLGDDSLEVNRLPCHDSPAPAQLPPLMLDDLRVPVWVGVDQRTGRLERVVDARQAVAAFCEAPRRLKSDLAMVALKDDILVNGLPALPVTVLGAKDSLALAPGCLCYVTERVRPFVGTPSGELLGKKCPVCRIPADDKTRVVTCQCGALYHHETKTSHPDVADEDRLSCFEKVQVCLVCGRPVTMDEYLVWDPSSL